MGLSSQIETNKIYGVCLQTQKGCMAFHHFHRTEGGCPPSCPTTGTAGWGPGVVLFRMVGDLQNMASYGGHGGVPGCPSGSRRSCLPKKTAAVWWVQVSVGNGLGPTRHGGTNRHTHSQAHTWLTPHMPVPSGCPAHQAGLCRYMGGGMQGVVQAQAGGGAW